MAPRRVRTPQPEEPQEIEELKETEELEELKEPEKADDGKAARDEILNTVKVERETSPKLFLHLILQKYKYDTTEVEQKPLILFSPGPATLVPTMTLGEIKRQKQVPKAYQNVPFCLESGVPVEEDLTLKDYLNSSGKEYQKDSRSSLTIQVFLKYKKKIRGATELLKNNYKSALDFDLKKNKPDLDIKNELPTIGSSFRTESITPSSGRGAERHPADMTEKDWNIVIRNNALLCGHRVKTRRDTSSSKAFPTALEIAPYPAFVLKGRVMEEWEALLSSRSSTTETISPTLRIPVFHVDDDSFIEVTETNSSIAKSMVKSSISNFETNLALSGGAWGVSAAVDFGVAKSNSSSSATNNQKKRAHLTMTFNFPRVCMTFDQGSLELSQSCKADVKAITDMASLERFEKKYGNIFATRVQLGGRLVSNTSTEVAAESSVEEAAEAFKISGSASFSYGGIGGSASANYETNEGEKKGSKSARFNQNVAWEGQGGDTLLSNNPQKWCPTVASFYNWRVVKRDDVIPLEGFIGQMEGYQHIPAKFKEIRKYSTHGPVTDQSAPFTGPYFSFKLKDRSTGKYLTMPKFNAEYKDPQLLQTILSAIKNHGDGLSVQDHNRLIHEATFNYDLGTYITMEDEGKKFNAEEAINTFTAMHPSGRFARELNHFDKYIITDISGTQYIHITDGRIAAYPYFHFTSQHQPPTGVDFYCTFQTPGIGKKHGKISGSDILELVARTVDGRYGILKEVPDSFTCQSIPWDQPWGIKCNFQIIYV